MSSSPYPFSRILSYILHPLLIPTLVTAALLMRPELYTLVLPVSLKIRFLLVVFVFTTVIPAAGVLLLLRVNAIYSVQLQDRAERTLPLLIASTSFMVMLYLLKTTNIPPLFLYVLYSATFALLTGLLVNLAYKISLHTLAWGAVAATLTSIALRMGISSLMVLILATWLLSGLAGYARLKENAHNQAQVYLGYVAGVCVVILISFLG